MTTYKIIGPVDEISAAQMVKYMKGAKKRDRELQERYMDTIIAASKMISDNKKASDRKRSPDPEYGDE